MNVFDKQYYVFNYVNNLFPVIFMKPKKVQDISSDYESDYDSEN